MVSLERDAFSTVMDSIHLRLKAEPGKVTTIGIDGPTASGKTTLAGRLKEKLESEGVKCSIFSLDWALKERKARAEDLTWLRKDPSAFEYEAELHANLAIVEDFLRRVVEYNQGGRAGSEEIVLKNLYNRADDGKLTHKEAFSLEPGTVILFEGHYTLRNEFDKYLDFNILLLGDLNELLDRKVGRVKGHRDPASATDYFWRIDIPSFRNHLRRFGLNADLVIDNTDYSAPFMIDSQSVLDWLVEDHPGVLPSPQLESEEGIGDFIFSNSLYASASLKDAVAKALSAVRTWDQKAGSYIRVNMQSIDMDLTAYANKVVSELNQETTGEYRFRLTHLDSLHKVYYRQLPLSLSIGVYSKESKSAVVSIIADIFQPELSVQVVWAGGYRRLSFKRELGAITTVLDSRVEDATGLPFEPVMAKGPITVWLPTDFTILPFIKDHEHKLVYIRKEDEIISPSQALTKLMRSSGIWIHRFALFSELSFFRDVQEQLGMHSVQIGNYLVCVNHPDPRLRANFQEFKKEWEMPLAKKALFRKAYDDMDSLVVFEREDAKDFVRQHCHLYSMMDGYLFSDFMYGSDAVIKDGLLQLKSMLLCDNRLLRKRAVQFISRHFPMLSLNTESLWDDLPGNARKSVYLDEFVKIAPSIMAEIYLWLAVRKERSAILGCNIYDVRHTSIDSQAYLESASSKGVPIVLQGSLNALGQLEVDKSGKTHEGYLKLEEGPVNFVGSVMRSARDLLLVKGKQPPLFGIGLDHVTSKYDNPPGRAARFLKASVETGFLTHYVPDAEGLYEPVGKGEAKNPYRAMAEFSANLHYDLKSTYLIDREVCAGELNYVDKIAKVQSVDDMRLFMVAYQEALERRNHLALLSRPMLFIGNLGTTHHGQDKFPPSVDTAVPWRDALKSENFVSPVLHGTTNTHKGVLHKAAHGCHKINLAGEFLGVIIDNLPEHISRVIYDSDVEPKRMMAAVRPLMNKTPDSEFEQLHSSLVKACDAFIDTVSSPRLTNMDISYFQYMPYVFTEKQALTIAAEIKQAIEKYRTFTESPRKAEGGFAASMIEVPEEEMVLYLDTLWKSGIRHFHIDAGDGKFIPREFSGVSKAQQIRAKYPAARMHAHIMAENPHFPKAGEVSLVEQYARAGCDAIAVHPRAFSSRQELYNALSLIRNLGCRPGIVIETHDALDSNLEEIIRIARLDWVVIMGVPIGYGGQIFHFPTLQTIANMNAFFSKQGRDFTIEADGGLTLQTLELCKNAGADIFAGWSIVKAKDQKEFFEKLKAVNQVLRGNGMPIVK